jgi:hypothetical protein
MAWDRLKLILSAVAFLAWIGWLAYLVWDLHRQPTEVRPDGKEAPVVLSRPQLLIADWIVTAEVEGGGQKPTTAVVKAVHWPEDGNAQKWKDQAIPVENLADSRGLSESGTKFYILPLIHDRDGFRVAPVPPSPGYPPRAFRADDTGPSLVYPSDMFTLEQLKQFLAKRREE